uniref:Uncharacterized protein n=1 Tax=Sphingobacterium sp. (strain 21) TaxID=743722 RepID=F4C594_SPHS2
MIPFLPNLSKTGYKKNYLMEEMKGYIMYSAFVGRLPFCFNVLILNGGVFA